MIIILRRLFPVLNVIMVILSAELFVQGRHDNNILHYSASAIWKNFDIGEKQTTICNYKLVCI